MQIVSTAKFWVDFENLQNPFY